ncbi:ankyrin [Nemania sp. FL0031]|nr:ankyrin [Nemania sp. FL0031]
MSTRGVLLPASADLNSLSDQQLSKLRELYIEQNKTAAEVEEIMKNHPEFPTLDTKFYKNGLHALGLVKKISLQQWVAVQTHVLKRKRQGKETYVYLSDQLQSQEKIDRIIKRAKKGPQLLTRMTRGPTPELPAQVSLRTPTIPPVIIPILEVPHTNAGTFYRFEQLSHLLRREMLSNPKSTVQLLSSVPTNQILLGIFGRGSTVGIRPSASHGHTSLKRDSLAPVHEAASVLQQHHESGYISHYIDPNIPAQGSLYKFGLVCTILANHRDTGAIDMREIVDWVGADANRTTLRSFFALDLPSVPATWIRLIELSTKLKSRAAFQSLVEVGFETHNEGWIFQHAAELFRLEVHAGLIRPGQITTWIFLFEPTPDALVYYWSTLLDNIYVLDFAKFAYAGVKVEFSVIVRFLQPSDNRKKRIKLLENAGIDFDCCINSMRLVDHRTSISGDPGYIPWSLLDQLWFSREADIYDALVGDSVATKTEITIPRLVLAARSGTRQLYLDSRPAQDRRSLPGFFGHGKHKASYTSRKVLLEAALSIAARLGNIAAITSFCEAGVDPNVSMLVSHTEQPGWHPLIQAAGEKHFDAVTMLIQMGADPEVKMGDLSPLSAAIRAPQLLPDAKQLGKRKTIKYLLGILSRDFVQENGATALIKEVMPPEYTPRTWDTYRNYIPDKEVLDMLLKAGIELNARVQAGKDLLHLAIDMDCNLETVDVLLSCGAQVHSRRDDEGTTMLETALRSRSPHRLQIVERLLQSGASGISELNAHAILEMVLPPIDGYAVEAERGRLLFLLLTEGPFLTAWPTLASWTPILTRLLSYEVPDELIDRVVKSGASINAPGFSGFLRREYTPLQLAVLKGRLNIAYQLLQQGADINAKASPYGHTVLQAACDPEENVEIPLAFIQFLIKRGADINANDSPSSSNATALHHAVFRGSNQVLCALLDAGASVHALGQVKFLSSEIGTVLDAAASWGRLDMVYILLNQGAQSYTRGKTRYYGAIKHAEGKGHFEIVEMIRSFAQRRTC